MGKIGSILPLSFLCQLLYLTQTYGPQRPELTERQVTASFTLDSEQLSMNEPVMVNFKIQNDSNRTFKVDLGKNRKESFLLTVRRPDGTTISVPHRRSGGLGRMGSVVVDAGQEYRQKLLLNEWTQFSLVGKYDIKIALASPVVAGDGVGNEDSNPSEFSSEVKLLISPRDPVQLKETCESLAGQVERASSYEQAAQPALALSYVRDPIAVPYLDRVLHARRLVEVFAISGLEAIANEDAVRTMISALSIHEPPETASIARAGLESIEEKTSDENIRQIIKQAVAQGEGKP
jgi:hypothetical protein